MRARTFIPISLVLLLGVPMLACTEEAVVNEPASAETSQAMKRQVEITYGQLPLSFEANQGQANPEVKFLSRGSGYNLFLTPTEAILSVRTAVASPVQSEEDAFPTPTRSKAARPTPTTILRMKVHGANSNPRISGLEQLPGKSNYFIGNDPAKWRTDVPRYAQVRYQGIYPGIDLVYYGTNQRQLEYDFIVTPGTDPAVIALKLEGADRLEVGEQGDLVLYFSDDEVRLRRPHVYQEASGERREIGGGYLLKGGGEVAFEVAAYDASKPLIIDPVLSYSTYLGGSDVDVAHDVAVDTSGNMYVTGQTSSTDFPTANPLQPTFGGGDCDVFVSKLNPTGSALIYSTYLGGNGPSHPTWGQGCDSGHTIAVDAVGNAYVAGRTESTNFPIANPFQAAHGGSGWEGDTWADAFVSKLDPTGSALIYSTYLGGNRSDWVDDIAVDPIGSAYVTGVVYYGGFPITAGVLQPTYGGYWVDAFVTKFGPTGSLVYSTYLGGSRNEQGLGIAADAAGNAYVSGATESTNFPTVNPLQGARAGLWDAFVSKVNPTASALVYSTYLGGSAIETYDGIAIDTDGNAYVSGVTQSADFPTANPFQSTHAGGDYDAFVSKLNPTGSALVYSTYLGGSGTEYTYGNGIAVDTAGNAYVRGQTSSTDFPTVHPLQPAFGGGTYDIFVSKLNPTGSALAYSTYLGGSGRDWGSYGNGIAIDSAGNAYIAGGTSSTDFPTTVDAFQPAFWGGNYDGFLAKLTTACNDTLDNDSDGYTDYPDDPGCWGYEDLSEELDCRDGLDNDGDGDTDYHNDSGCTDYRDESEEPQCSDGIENEFDGLIDFPEDPDCTSPLGVTEAPPFNIVCGLGVELALVLAPLMWLYRRRRRRL